MLQEGLLARHENSPRYKVGNLLFEVSQLYRLNSSLIELTDDVLKAICRETGHTGYLSILDGADVLVIRMHQGSHALRVFTPLGQRAPAFATANGRTLLARLSDDEVRAIHSDGLGVPSPNSPQGIDELLAALVEVRRKGWEEADDEAIPGVGSISVSVADPKLRESIGFCISYSASNIGTEEKNRIIALLTAAAHRIARGSTIRSFRISCMSFPPLDRSQREAGCASCGRQRLSFYSVRVSLMRQLNSEDIEALAVGAWILGTGGGGSPYHALLNLRRLYADGSRDRPDRHRRVAR